MHIGRWHRSRVMRLAEEQAHLIVLIVILCILFFIQIRHLHDAAFAISDEGVHSLAGIWIWKGMIPYKDFMYAEPPLVPIMIGFFHLFSYSLFPARTVYLLANLSSVVPLYLLLKRASRNALAALTASLFYVTYYQMVEHNFRFIALRQVATVLLIWFLYLGIMRERNMTSFCTQVLLSIASIFTFIPSALNLLFFSLAAVMLEPRDKRVRTFARYVGMGLISVAVLLLFSWLIPESFSAVVADHFQRPLVARFGRIAWTMDWGRKDIFLYVLSIIGLFSGLVFNKSMRWFCLAGIAMIGIVFLPKEFFPHYFDSSGPAFAIGICSLIVLSIGLLHRLPRPIQLLPALVLLMIHWTIVLQPLFDEWSNNRDIEYQKAVSLLATLPEPVLTFFEPVFAVEAGKEVVHDPLLADFRTYGSLLGQQLPHAQYDALSASACTIFLSPWDTGYIPQDIQQKWLQEYEVVPFSSWATILLTHNAGCYART